MAHHDEPAGEADDPRGLHIFLVRLHQRRAAGDAGELRPVSQADGDDDDVDREFLAHFQRQSGAADAVDQDGEEDAGDGQLHVGDPHDDRVRRAADISGDDAKRDAEHHAEADRRQPDDDRQPPAIEDGRQHVPALIVGAKQVLRLSAFGPCRGQLAVPEGDLGRIERVERRDQRRGETGEDGDQGHRRRDHRAGRMGERPVDVVVLDPLPAGHGTVFRDGHQSPSRMRGSTTK